MVLGLDKEQLSLATKNAQGVIVISAAQNTRIFNFTAVKGGSLQLLIKDADVKIVLDKNLIAGQGEDTRSGVILSGTPGYWTVTINLTVFKGDGSFSLSKGN